MKLKRIIAGIVTFSLALSAAMTPYGTVLPLPTATQQASAATYGDYEYTIVNGTIEITGYTGNDTVLVIPSEIDGKKVTSIRWDVFQDCKSLTSITIPGSVTIIGGRFSGCTSLTSINVSEDNMGYCSVDGVLFNKAKTEIIRYPVGKSDKSYAIPDNVMGISYSAFEGCTSLTNITIPDSVTSIGCESFRNCSSLESIPIPDSVTSIENYAFSGCKSLKSITIPNGVTSIRDTTFLGCESLTDIYYNGTKAQWDEIIGDYNQDLTKAVIHCSDGDIDDRFKYDVLDDGTAKIINYYGNDIELAIPSEIDGKKVTSIGDNAFRCCESLTITIPNSVKSIGFDAFSYCSSLTNITIPDSVTSIGDWAFEHCSNLTSITIPDSVTSIGDWAFYECASLKSITIPDSVTSIGNSAFSDCSNLTNITIPDSVTSIGGQAFAGCKRLTSIAIPSGVKSIDDIAFSGCSSLTSITIPNSVTTIGWSAFDGCESLTSITIPDSVTSIGDCAFGNCSSLTSINVSKDNKSYCSVDGVLFNKAKTKIICYPAGKSGKSYAIPDSVTSIGEYAFFFCTNLTSITIPNSVTSIGDGAFNYCTSLTSISIPDGVTSIGDGAFNYCTSLKSITIPNSVTKIGNYAFNGCGSLSDVYYNGTEEQWKKIKLTNNEVLLNAKRHYNSGAATTKVSAPTGLKLKGRAADALRIGWNKNANADGYIVEMYKGGKWTRVAKITKNTTTEWRQSGLAAGTAYKFRVKAYKMNGSTAKYSSYVNISARTNPSAVKGLKVLGKAKDALRIGWTKNTSADGYIVEMYSGGKWVRVAKITKNTTVQYRKAGLKKGTTYKFRVRAYKMSGSTALYSGYTNITAATNK